MQSKRRKKIFLTPFIVRVLKNPIALCHDLTKPLIYERGKYKEYTYDQK